MVDRIKAAVDARTDPDFVIMARTDALAVEGLDAAIDRARRLRRGRRRHDLPRGDHRARDVPGVRRRGRRCRSSPTSPSSAQTPLFTVDELRSADVAIALYPLSAFRAMNKAALNVYEALRRDGTQKNVVDDDADARRALRLSRLPRLRAEARSRCSPSRKTLTHRLRR